MEGLGGIDATSSKGCAQDEEVRPAFAEGRVVASVNSWQCFADSFEGIESLRVRCFAYPSCRVRKRHMNINFLVRLPLRRPRDCPRDKPRFSPYFTQREPSLSLGQSQGRRAAENVHVPKVCVPFSLAKLLLLRYFESSQL